jgi:general secretion pathway protein D
MKQFLLSLLISTLCIGSTALSAPPAKTSNGASQAAHDEIVRRQEAQQQARLLIDQGLKLYYSGRYEDAIAKLEAALKILPRAKVTEIDYNRAVHALTDCYYRLADTAYRAGDNKKAKELAQKALEYDPRNRSADSLLVKIKSAETHAVVVAAQPAVVEETAPDKTSEFTGKKDQIKKLFREGKILLNSGQYDEAERRFQQVLLIDPYNEDAHLLMGEVNKARLNITQTGADEARTRALWQVTDAWIPPVSREVKVPERGEGGGVIGASAMRQAEIMKKLNNIIIPEINFREAVITDVIKYLGDESRKLDPDKVGVNIVLQLGEAAPGPAPAPGAPAAPAAPTAPGAEAPGAEAGAPSEVGGGRKISLNLRNIPLIEALKYVTSAAGLKFRVESSAVLVLPINAPEGDMITRSYPVQSGAIKQVITTPTTTATKTTTRTEYTALAGEGATVGVGDVKQFFIDAGVPFPTGSSLAYNERTSTIIVRNTPENLETFERILATLNVVPSQVEIEAKFVEIAQSDLDELGFHWLIGASTPNQGKVILEGGSRQSAVGAPPTDADEVTVGNRDSAAISGNALDALLAGGAGGPIASQIGSIRGILSDIKFTLLVNALSQKKSTDVLSAPKVTTISGSSAQIKVVQEFIYPTEFTQPQVTAAGGGTSGGGAVGVTPSTPSNFKTREIGVLLNVTPTVGADGYTINLTLIPEVSEFLGFIDYGGPFSIAAGLSALTATNSIKQPLFSSRNLTTSIVIWDGQTVVLGGLLREDIQKIDDKTPFFGDIPWIGRLFRSKVTQRSKRNLLVFVTARLIDPAGNPIHRQQSAALR